MRLSVEQVAERLNTISKGGLKPDWRFGNAPYNTEHPAPAVSPWYSFFTMSRLLLRPDATREVLLNAIRPTHDGTRMQVLAVEPACSGKGRIPSPRTWRRPMPEMARCIGRVSFRTKIFYKIGQTTMMWRC